MAITHHQGSRIMGCTQVSHILCIWVFFRIPIIIFALYAGIIFPGHSFNGAMRFIWFSPLFYYLFYRLYISACSLSLSFSLYQNEYAITYYHMNNYLSCWMDGIMWQRVCAEQKKKKKISFQKHAMGLASRKPFKCAKGKWFTFSFEMNRHSRRNGLEWNCV